MKSMSITEYYVTGHTADGIVYLLTDNIADVKKIIVLKHPSKLWKTAVLTAYREAANHEELEWLSSRYGRAFCEGVINLTQSIAILTEEALPEQHDFSVQEIDLVTAYHLPVFETDYLENGLSQNVTEACQYLKKGLQIHDDLEQIYVNEIQTARADKLARELAEDILKDVHVSEKDSIVKRRMFGTNTPEGAINSVSDLVENLKTVYMLHGRAGTGKSTLMRHVTNECLKKGLNLELYHCSFDPNSIDMVRVPELSVAVFDATSPHAFSPWKTGQYVIDTYEAFVNEGTDEKYQQEIEYVASMYKRFIKKGMTSLQRVGDIIEKQEEPYKLEYHAYESQLANVAYQLVEVPLQ